MENSFRTHLCAAIDQLQKESNAVWTAKLFMPVVKTKPPFVLANVTVEKINILDFVGSSRVTENKLYFSPVLFPPHKDTWKLLQKELQTAAFHQGFQLKNNGSPRKDSNARILVCNHNRVYFGKKNGSNLKATAINSVYKVARPTNQRLSGRGRVAGRS